MNAGGNKENNIRVNKYVNSLFIRVDKTKILTLQAFKKGIFPHINSPNSNKVYINK